MENKERAEKIFSLFIAQPSYRDIAGEHQQILNTITSQLDAAVREANIDRMEHVNEASKVGFKAGFASALEKVRDVIWDWHTSGQKYDLAERIRALEVEK